MKRTFAFLICILMAVSIMGCTGAGQTPNETDSPEALLTDGPTEAATDAPTEEPAEAPTEAPVHEGLLYKNSLDMDLSFQLLSYRSGYMSEYADHDPLDVPAGGVGEADFFRPVYDYQKRCSIAAYDEGGQYYYVYDITLDNHDVVELRAEGEGYVFEVVHDGASSVYPACAFVDSEPDGEADEHILSVNVVSAAGQQAGDRLMTGGWEYAWVTYQYTELTPECAAEYPKLAKAIANDSDNLYYELIFRYHSLCASIQHSTTQVDRGSLVQEAFVRRADDKVYSVLYRFAETALSTQVLWSSCCFDSQTGEAIALTDIVTDVTAFTEAVNEKLARLGTEARAEEQYWTQLDYVDRPVWTLDRCGVSVFLYDGREGVSCCLPFAEYSELFREEYKPENEDYTMYFPIGTKTCFEAEGSLGELLLKAVKAAPSHIRAEYNGEEYDFEQIEIGAHTPLYFVTHVCGMDFIHVFGANDECDSLCTIAVQNGRLYYMGQIACSQVMTPSVSKYDVNIWNTLLVTDPGYFAIEYRTDAVGTAFGRCPTAFGGSGLAHRLSDIFTFDVKLRLKQDMDADVVDEEGNIIGSISLKKGDEVTYYRIDYNGTYADFITSDGSIARMKLVVDWNEGEPTANGIPMSELFENIYWV